MDLKPKRGGGLIWEKCGPLYYTLWSLWPNGGGVFGPPRPPPPPPPGYGPAIKVFQCKALPPGNISLSGMSGCKE